MGHLRLVRTARPPSVVCLRRTGAIYRIKDDFAAVFGRLGTATGGRRQARTPSLAPPPCRPTGPAHPFCPKVPVQPVRGLPAKSTRRSRCPAHWSRSRPGTGPTLAADGTHPLVLAMGAAVWPE
jgi:hypothetical protein